MQIVPAGRELSTKTNPNLPSQGGFPSTLLN